MRYRERPDSPRSTLMILFLRSACEVILVVLSVRFEYYDIPRGINITNDIFKIIITLLCLLNLVYIIYLFSKRGVLSGIGFLDILRENDNSKNPVPPAVDKIIGGNETTIDEINL
ncbi:hypothetical protein RclHR1_00720035 [Rhizophagus clarus]|uniref:Uncharacterized protein n=1 Tax=Rhizophagus clarus TaxID=94130 RepID=A0A2Z6RVL0_9GLOM|nr:hypothetical protein RclHR1_00720035 [Rhizophagus clarus]